MATKLGIKALGALVEKVRDGASFKLMLLVAGHETQDQMAAYTTVAALLAGTGNDRCTAVGYADLTVTPSVVEAVAFATVDITIDPEFPAVTAGQNCTQAVLYEFITNDAGSVPVVFFDCDIDTDGNVIVLRVDANGIHRATNG